MRTSVISLLFAASLLACGGAHEHAAGPQGSGHDLAHGHMTADNPVPAHGAALTLNKGKRWTADDHTDAAALRIDALLVTTPADVPAFHALGKALQDEVQQLISGCTMSGPDHDQLHVFLEALLPKVSHLRESVVAADLQTTHAHLVALMKDYHLHFE